MSEKRLPRVGVHIKSEVSGLSKESITLTGGACLSATVLGKLADGRYRALDISDGATEGNEAAGVLFGHYDAESEDVPALAHTDLTAVYGRDLVWPEGISEPQKAAAIAELRARFIKIA